MIPGLIITLLVFVLLYALSDDMLKKHMEARVPKPPDKFPVRFFGGPIDGHEDEIEEKRAHFYIPAAPDEDDETVYVQVGGMQMQEAMFAKYTGIGDEGDYFYVEKVSREEMVRELMKEDHGRA